MINTDNNVPCHLQDHSGLCLMNKAIINVDERIILPVLKKFPL